MKIIIDADGCPRQVLQVTRHLGTLYQLPVWTVANYNHAIESDHHVTVSDDPQAVDLHIVSVADPGDLVVTADGGLAAMVLGGGARCLHPSGREYSELTIDYLLEERELKARHRRQGGRTRGPRKRTAKEDHVFECVLRQILDESRLS